MVDHGVLLTGDTFSSFLTLVFLWWFRLEVELGDQVPVLTHGVLIHRARVEVLFIDSSFLGSSRSLVLGRRTLSVELNVGESEEQILTLGVFKETSLFVPSGTLEVESMDPDTLSRFSDVLTFNTSIICNQGVAYVSYIRARLNSI